MDGAGDQLFPGSGLSEDQGGRIGRRHTPDLVEYGFERRTLAYNLLEPALISIPIGRRKSLQVSHRTTPEVSCRTWRLAIQLTIQCCPHTIEQNLVVKRFCQELDRTRSPCAVIKMIGILCRSAFSVAWSSRPDIPGIRMSEIRHAVCRCFPD